MAEYTTNGSCRFNLRGQALYWNTGTENIFLINPDDLTEENAATYTVQAGDVVGDAYDTTYYTWGEGPVSVVLGTNADATIYAGTPYFRVEGTVVDVHPTQDQIEAGNVGSIFDHDTYVVKPTTPATIEGVLGTDDTEILGAVLSALSLMDLINNQTTTPEA